jgi:hypothetical protein
MFHRYSSLQPDGQKAEASVRRRQLTDILCIPLGKTNARKVIPERPMLALGEEVGKSVHGPVLTMGAKYHRRAIVTLSAGTIDVLSTLVQFRGRLRSVILLLRTVVSLCRTRFAHRGLSRRRRSGRRRGSGRQCSGSGPCPGASTHNSTRYILSEQVLEPRGDGYSMSRH